MVVAERPPSGSADDASVRIRVRAAVDGRDADLIVPVLDEHLRRLVAVIRHRHAGTGGTSEFRGREISVAHLEGGGQIALQAAVPGVSEDAGGDHGHVRVEAAQVVRRSFHDHGVEPREHRAVLQPGDCRQLSRIGGFLQESLRQRGPYRELAVHAIGHGRARVEEVGAGLDAFVAHPIGVLSVGVIVRQ